MEDSKGKKAKAKAPKPAATVVSKPKKTRRDDEQEIEQEKEKLQIKVGVGPAARSPIKVKDYETSDASASVTPKKKGAIAPLKISGAAPKKISTSASLGFGSMEPPLKVATAAPSKRESVAPKKTGGVTPKIGAALTPRKIGGVTPSKASALKPRLAPKEPELADDQRELLYYGRHICEVLADKRRDDIIRVYCTEETLPHFGSLLRWCSQNKKAYHVIPNEEMEKVTHSVHHEGIAILSRTPENGLGEHLLDYLKNASDLPLLVVDGVQNPHNIGIIMRVMASFGWPVLVGAHDLPALSGAAARMSEGGAEFVRAFRCEDLSGFLRELKQIGYRILGSSSHAGTSIYDQDIPKKTAWVVGSEVYGISRETAALLDGECAIPSSGQVESLNVAVACGLLLGEYTRRHGLGGGERADLRQARSE